MNLSFNMLNHAMLTQVLHELRLGNLQRCKALGLSEDDLFLLQSLPPTTLSRLAHATVPWLEVKIDSPVLHRLIEQAERDEQNERLINRALKLGASSTIMYQCFGLAHSETAMRRRLLKIETRKGRPQHLSEAQDGTEDKLDAMMMLAEEQQISLTIVWQQIDQYSNKT